MTILDVLSPNFSGGRKGYRPEAIVVHIMEGTLAGTDSWFRNPLSRVSAHYGVGRTGDVHRYVRDADTAWHAGRVHAPAWTGIRRGTNNLYVNPNFYTLGIEHEGNEQSDWTDAMYASSSQLIADCAIRWSIPLDRSHVVGHHEIYSLKTCPGFRVDLGQLLSLARQKAGASDPVDFVAKGGIVTTTTRMNLRRNFPSTTSPLARTVDAHTPLQCVGYTKSGENVNNVKKWYKTSEGFWVWSGGVG